MASHKKEGYFQIINSLFFGFISELNGNERQKLLQTEPKYTLPYHYIFYSVC